jgi:hypothetical protein
MSGASGDLQCGEKGEGAMMAAAREAAAPPGLGRRALDWWLNEMRHLLPPTIFFFIGFNLIVLTTNLILTAYLVAFSSFMLATAGALVVGKVVLVADKMPFMRRFDGAPLLQPILFKTVVYCAFVFIARLLEHLVRFMWEGGTPGGFLAEVASTFSWSRFAAVQIWIFVLFLLYVTGSELNALFGDGELAKIFLTRRYSELKLTRHQRIRELVGLSRLAALRPGEIGSPGTAANRELMAIVARLGERG